MLKTIKIGSRKSPLAIKQTEIVISKLQESFPNDKFEIVEISTKGDEILNKALSTLGGKGVFTKELENALLNHKIDMAVHSAKDMPAMLPEGLTIGAVLEREDARDVIVTTANTKLENLKEGDIVGTGSLRREIQIKEINPCVSVKLIRGNINTRLDKLKSGEYSAIALAMAGIKRMDLLNERGLYFEVLDSDKFISAAGQGILTVETRAGDMQPYMQAINSENTAIILSAERAFLEHIGGSCNAPIGAYANIEDNKIKIRTLFADGGKVVRLSGESYIQDAAELGQNIAKETLRKC